jgi:hypothetical protein
VPISYAEGNVYHLQYGYYGTPIEIVEYSLSVKGQAKESPGVIRLREMDAKPRELRAPVVPHYLAPPVQPRKPVARKVPLEQDRLF